MTFVYRASYVNVSLAPGPESWRCKSRTPAMVYWEGVVSMPAKRQHRPRGAVGTGRFYSIFVSAVGATLWHRGSELHSWTSVLLSEALQVIPFLLASCRPIALLAILTAATHDVLPGAGKCDVMPSVVPGLEYGTLRAEVLTHLGVPAELCASLPLQSLDLSHPALWPARNNSLILSILIEYEKEWHRKVVPRCAQQDHNLVGAGNACMRWWPHIEEDEDEVLGSVVDVCVKGITSIAKVNSEFYHFMRGHFFEALVMLQRHGLAAVSDSGNSSISLSSAERRWRLTFGDPVHMCPPSFLDFYSLVTSRVGVHTARGGVGFDNDCMKARLRSRSIILTFPSLELTTNDRFDWSSFLRSCKMVPGIARGLALKWLGQTGATSTLETPKVLLLRRRRGRDFINYRELADYIVQLCSSSGDIAGPCESHEAIFEELAWHEQVRHMVNCNALIAFHGAAAGAHEVWMPRGSVVVEFQPLDAWYCTIAYCMAAEPAREMLYILSTNANTAAAFPAEVGAPLPSALRHVGPSHLAFHSKHNHRRHVGLEALTALGNAVRRLQAQGFGTVSAQFLRCTEDGETGRIVRGACFGTALQVYESGVT